MSLVSEALKKAERDAAAREARERGLPVPLETPLQPYRARRGQRRAGGARLWLAAGGVAAAVFLAVLLARPAFESEAPGKVVTVPASDAAAAPSTRGTSASPPAPAPQPVATGKAEPEPTAAPSASEPQAPGAGTLPLPKTATEAPPTQPSASEPQAPSPRTPSLPQTAAEAPPEKPSASEPRARSEASRPAEAGEFVRRIDFPGGSKLELGGIAYSETAPFAYLNGKLLKVGEGTAGYTLVRIERDRVVVRGEAGELTIRLKPR